MGSSIAIILWLARRAIIRAWRAASRGTVAGGGQRGWISRQWCSPELMHIGDRVGANRPVAGSFAGRAVVAKPPIVSPLHALAALRDMVAPQAAAVMSPSRTTGQGRPGPAAGGHHLRAAARVIDRQPWLGANAWWTSCTATGAAVAPAPGLE
jgi:hypothetical protein